MMTMDNHKLLFRPGVPVGNIDDCNCWVNRPLFGRMAAADVVVVVVVVAIADVVAGCNSM